MAENPLMEDQPVKDERKTKKQLIAELEELRQKEVDRTAMETVSGSDLENRLEHLTRLAVALSREHNLGLLMENIVDSARELTRADAGFLAVVVDGGRQLGMMVVQNETLGQRLSGAAEPLNMSLPLLDDDGNQLLSSAATFVFHRNQPVNIADIYADDRFLGPRKFDEMTGYSTRSMLIVPLRDYRDSVIGVLQLVNATDPNQEEPVPFTAEDETLVTSLGSLAAVALDNTQLIRRQTEQAEQARQERAVERVRAAVMAMRGSDDLLKIVGAIMQELTHLGIDVVMCFINFVTDEEANQILSYRAIANPKKQGISWTSPELVEINDDFATLVTEFTAWDSWFEPWRQQKVSYYKMTNIYRLDEMYLEYLNNPDFDVLPHFSIESAWVMDVPFTYGTIGLWDTEHLEDHVAIVQELAEALSLGYTRFLDFQRVEEAQKKLIDELEEELQTAHDMQMGLMPTESPQIDAFDIAGSCLPANHVGGDFFQYFPQNGKLSISLADVTGHAMEAAVPVMMFSGILKSQMEIGGSVEEIFGRLNRSLHGTLDKRTFVCFTMGELDTETRTFHLANGGCPYPYHFQASIGEISELQLDAYPLAIRPDSEYQTIDIQLDAGDHIIFCSDGIIEAENGEGEIYGFEQTAETIRQGCSEDLSAEALIDHLIGAVKAFAGETPQGDDMTVVVLKVEG